MFQEIQFLFITDPILCNIERLDLAHILLHEAELLMSWSLNSSRGFISQYLGICQEKVDAIFKQLQYVFVPLIDYHYVRVQLYIFKRTWNKSNVSCMNPFTWINHLPNGLEVTKDVGSFRKKFNMPLQLWLFPLAINFIFVSHALVQLTITHYVIVRSPVLFIFTFNVHFKRFVAPPPQKKEEIL